MGYQLEEIESTGNWLDYNWYDAAANDLSNYDRTHNAVNEITGWTKSSTSVGTIAYDAAGQMTQNDRYRYVYDGFGRLVALKDAAGSAIATYGYNGLGFRIWEQPNGGDKRFFCYDERWRIVATFDDTNATPTRRVIHHAAGAAGMGGSSYIDSVILEDANDDTGDANLETRYYPLQNWRADVVCVGKLNDEDFQLVEVVDYDTYGNALSRPAVSADFDHDGGVNGSDLSDFFTAHGNGDPEADADLSGGITNDDIGVFYAAYEAGIYGPSRGACAYSGVIAGYAGYVRDRWAPDLYHVRHRVYDTRMGTWTKRDPLGYVDGMGLVAYVSMNPVLGRDPEGLLCARDSSTPTQSVGRIPIPPCLDGFPLLSQFAWDYLVSPAYRIAMDTCGKSPSIVCAPCAPPPGGLIPCMKNSSSLDRYGGCTITICTNAPAICFIDGVAFGFASKLVHELTHCRQGCDPGFIGPPATYEESICREMEAYRRGGECYHERGAARNRCLCSRACDSVANPTFPRRVCLDACMRMAREYKCRNGHHYP